MRKTKSSLERRGGNGGGLFGKEKPQRLAKEKALKDKQILEETGVGEETQQTAAQRTARPAGLSNVLSAQLFPQQAARSPGGGPVVAWGGRAAVRGRGANTAGDGGRGGERLGGLVGRQGIFPTAPWDTTYSRQRSTRILSIPGQNTVT